MDVAITSPQNRFVKLYRSLGRRKARNKYQLLPLEGARLVHEAILAHLPIEAVILQEDRNSNSWDFLENINKSVPVLRISEKLLSRIAYTEQPQGILAIVKRPHYTLSEIFTKTPALILVADGIQDPGNMGTMIRSAAACGANGVILMPGTVDTNNPKTLRATMGAFFHIPVVESDMESFLLEMSKNELQLIVASGTASVTYDQLDWRKSTAVVIGNEGGGVSAGILAAADSSINIPMEGVTESLNAAVAMSVIFFEAARQRRCRQ